MSVTVDASAELYGDFYDILMSHLYDFCEL